MLWSWSSSRWRAESSSARRTPPPLPAHSSEPSVSLSCMASNAGKDDIEDPEIREEPVGNGKDDIEEDDVTPGAEPDGYSFSTDALSFPTIKKVPQKSRALEDGRYEPCHVSIGPYHHRGSYPSESLSEPESESGSHLWREMEKVGEKREWLGTLTKIAAAANEPQEGSHQDMKADLVTEISAQLNGTSARHYDYADVSCSRRSREELARMLLLDGCYLVARYGEVRETLRLLQQHKEEPASESSSTTTIRNELLEKETPGSGDKGVHALMVRDTWYILQNQIPFFVLEKIMRRVTGCSAEDARRGFTNYAHRLLYKQRMCISTDHPVVSLSKLDEEVPQPSIFHLLHLLHTLLLKPLAESQPESKSSKTKSKSKTTDDEKAERQWHRARDYRKYANVEFKGREIGDSAVALCCAGPCCCCCCCCCHDTQRQVSVLDVRIEGCNVVIPCLRVDGDTWTILLNLMALEGQHPWLGTHVTAYCLFMSQIACTREDVELLESKGVIDRHLRTPESVAADFSKLCDGVVLDRGDIKTNYLKPLWNHLDKRYKSRQQNVLAWLWLNYFTCRNISILVGVISAFILLLAGGLSAVYQVLSYYQSQKNAPAPPPSRH